MSKPRTIESEDHVFVSVKLEPQIVMRWNQKIKLTGLTKKEYIKKLMKNVLLNFFFVQNGP